LKTFIHTVHLLQSLTYLPTLPVSDILIKLLETEGGQGPPPGLSGNKHVLCWGLEDMLASPEKEAKDKDKEKSKGIQWSRQINELRLKRARFMVFNATFNNISVISWRSVLLVEENGVPGENY